MSSPVDSRLPKVGRVPVWFLGIAILLSAAAAPLLLPISPSERRVIVVSLVALQGVFLLVAGTGRRYLAWSVLVLACILGISSILVTFGLYFEWRSTVEDIDAEPEHLESLLSEIDRIRIDHQDSGDPEDQDALKTQVPEAIEKARRESAERLEKLVADQRARRASLILSLGITLCLVAAFLGYYRLYVDAKGHV